jgi:hypothetical protein
MTKGPETLSKKEGIEKNQENPELAKIKGLFEQYEKETLYLRNFSEHTLKGCWRFFNRWLKYVRQMPTEQNLSQFVIEIRTARLKTGIPGKALRYCGFGALLKLWQAEGE